MRRGCAAATPRGREPPRKCRTRPFLVYCAGTRLCIANLAATKHTYSELWPGPPWAYQQKHTRFGDMRAETDRHGQAKSNPSPFALGNHLNPARGLNKLVPNQTSCCCLPAPQQMQVHSSPAHPSPRLSKQTTVRYNPTKDKTSCVQHQRSLADLGTSCHGGGADGPRMFTLPPHFNRAIPQEESVRATCKGLAECELRCGCFDEGPSHRAAEL